MKLSQDPCVGYDNNVNNVTKIKQKHFNLIAADSLVCYKACYETSSITMAMALMEVSLNRNIHIEFQTEINHGLKDSNGNITYDDIMKMECMDKMVNG